MTEENNNININTNTNVSDIIKLQEIKNKKEKNKEQKNAIQYYFDIIQKTISENSIEYLIRGHSIPIHSLEFLDGINITTYLELYYDREDNTYNLSLQIYDKLYYMSLYCEHLCSNVNLIEFTTKKNIKNIFKNILQIINSIKFCHIRLSFTKDKYVILYDGKFLNEKKINDCSICNIKTSCKTQCNHFICLNCVGQLQNSICPLCRKVLKF